MQQHNLPQINLSGIKINLLGICGSPRSSSNSDYLLNHTLEYLKSYGVLDIETFNFAGKNIHPCTACAAYCEKHKTCQYKDDFLEFLQKWLKADAIIWSVPVYTMGPPAIVRAAMDRLGELVFQNWGLRSTPLPYFNKACGVITQGSCLHGTQELAVQSMLDHFILMDCVPVSGDMSANHLGVIGHVPDKQSAVEDKMLLMQCRNLGVRVVEMARLLKAGTLMIADSLPDAYFYSRLEMGVIDRPVEGR